MKACKRFNLEHASFNYFEGNEGKNISDTVISIVKCAYLRDMLKHEQGIHRVKDIVSVIKSELKTTTEKFTYFLVEEFGTTESITSRDECLIDGMMKLQRLVTQNDKVILLPRTCTNCTVSVIHHEWKGRKEFVKPSDVSRGNDDDSYKKTKSNCTIQITKDRLMLIVMAIPLVMEMRRTTISLQKMGYPAKVFSLTDVPENMRNLFCNNRQKPTEKWYSENNNSLVK